MASTDYVVQDIKGIKKSFDNGSRASISRYMKLPVFNIQDTDEFSEIFTSTEGMGTFDALAEQETPQVKTLADGRSVTITAQRYGAAIQVTSTDRVKFNDSSVKVRKYLTRQRDMIMRKASLKFVTNIHEFFNDAFAGATYLAPDGVALCGAHLDADGNAWYTNSATAALDTTAMDAADTYAGAQVGPDAEENPLTWTHIVVKKGSAAARTAKKLFAENITPTAIADINIYEGALTIVETPYISSTNTNFWFLFDMNKDESPLYAGIQKFPTMDAPIRQNNGAERSNVEGFWNQGIINSPWFVYGSNGTT